MKNHWIWFVEGASFAPKLFKAGVDDTAPVAKVTDPVMVFEPEVQETVFVPAFQKLAPSRAGVAEENPESKVMGKLMEPMATLLAVSPDATVHCNSE
jgi:hypothetical protein